MSKPGRSKPNPKPVGDMQNDMSVNCGETYKIKCCYAYVYCYNGEKIKKTGTLEKNKINRERECTEGRGRGRRRVNS